MTPGLKQTSRGSSTHTAPDIQHDGSEHALGDTPRGAAEHADSGNMPRGAAQHAVFLEYSYVRATVDSAWSAIMDKQDISSEWANARLLSLARIKQHIVRDTHEPVTLEALLHAKPPRAKRQKRSWWSNVESISRCIAAYHHAVSASEHDSCDSIQQDICAYAYTLRQGLPSNVDVTEFFILLH